MPPTCPSAGAARRAKEKCVDRVILPMAGHHMKRFENQAVELKKGRNIWIRISPEKSDVQASESNGVRKF